MVLPINIVISTARAKAAAQIRWPSATSLNSSIAYSSTAKFQPHLNLPYGRCP